MTTQVFVNVPSIDPRTAVRVRQVSQNESQTYSEQVATENGSSLAFEVHSGAKLIIEEVSADDAKKIADAARAAAVVPAGAVARTAEQEEAARREVTPRGARRT